MLEIRERRVDLIEQLPDLMRLRWAKPLSDMVALVGGSLQASRFSRLLIGLKRQTGGLGIIDKVYHPNMVISFILASLFEWDILGGHFKHGRKDGEPISARDVYDHLLQETDPSNIETLAKLFPIAWNIVFDEVFIDGNLD